MDNREYIKNKFDNDGIRAPESLSEDSILRMLEKSDEISESAGTTGTEPKQASHPDNAPAERRRMRIRPENMKVLAIAASAMIVIFGLAAISPLLDRAPDTSVEGGELYSFRSTSEIKKIIRELDTSSGTGFYDRFSNDISEDPFMEYESDMAVSDSDSSARKGFSIASGQEQTAGSHSETYLQVEDVDEADIVKTDGRYIYYVNKAGEVVILEAKGGKAKKLSVIGSSGIENYVQDIFLKGDTLITIGTVYRSDDDQGGSGVVVYDISDRSKPEVVSDFRQTGDIVSSRMVGNYVYLVTGDYVRKGGRIVPMCGPYDSCRELGVSDILCMPDPKTPSYIVLSAVDISSGSQGKTATKAVFGASTDIYCNDHALYSASGEYDESSNEQFTRIARARLDGLDISFDATARIRGSIVNQFSMDESGGYFRIATTSSRAGMDVNNLYVLDKDLKESGKVTGFARNESIKAVRFMGSKAYVITYQAIDPLFIIDLADPTDPRIEGEVMIDGFSTLLIPVSEDRLLGIGHATGDNGYGGEYDNGLKLALFDISDPSEPKVLSSKEFKNMTSPAQSDHHALTVNSDEGWYAIPYDIYDYEVGGDDVFIIEDAESSAGADGSSSETADGGSSESGDAETSESRDSDPSESGDAVETTEEPEDYHQAGVLVFSTAGDKIKTIDRHRIDADQLYRSIFIEDWIYALDAKGVAGSFRPAK